MNRQDQLVKRYELFIAAAVIAAHASAGSATFRQRDVRFFIELFSNWIEANFSSGALELQNTQLARYLKSLCRDGYARENQRNTVPCYRLTRLGILELLQRLHSLELFTFDFVFFLNYFLQSYRWKIIELIENEGVKFPPSLKIEIEILLDARQFLKREIGRVQKELDKLRKRSSDSQRAATLAHERLKQGLDIELIAEEVGKKYPYGLDSRKPFIELIRSIPVDIAKWELSIGNARRPEIIWSPSSKMLNSYLECLKDLLHHK